MVTTCFAQDKATEVSSNEEKVEYYLELFGDYEYVDFDTAKIYLDSARQFGKDATDQNTLGKLELFSGWFYQDISQFDRSPRLLF